MPQSVKILLHAPYYIGLNRKFSVRLNRDAPSKPLSSTPSFTSLFVLSDIEGNFHALVNLLYNNNIIDDKYNWIFGKGQLVIVGDCFDRGEDVIECLWLIYSLEEKAHRTGGSLPSPVFLE